MSDDALRDKIADLPGICGCSPCQDCARVIADAVLSVVEDHYRAELTDATERAETAEEALRKVRALFANGPDTPCRTTWREERYAGEVVWAVGCVEVPLADLRDALGDQPQERADG